MVLAPSDNFGFLLDAARRPGGHSAQAPSVKKPCPLADISIEEKIYEMSTLH